ncbi:MAG: ATP-dependent Clp protease ATP-binding subunit, partial [Zoogloeaceae bacterium]|nr:ATP-dependent Clp protease ATP-binding subunit [Zoogloeaceae bacterium]
MTEPTPSFQKPRWLKDLLRFLPLKSQFVLSGNLRDLHAAEAAPGVITMQSFQQTLLDALLQAGYAALLLWNPVDGFRLLTRPGEAPDEALLAELLGGQNGEGAGGGARMDLLAGALERFVVRAGEPLAFLVDFASRIPVR